MQAKKLSRSLVFENSISTVIELGMHAFADTFLDQSMLSKAEPVFPLNVVFDKETGLVHNQFLIDATARYNWVDYAYTSANSNQSKLHFQQLAANVISQSKLNPKVLEIGANDGYLLKCLQSQGAQVTGIDASKYIVDKLLSNGIDAKYARFGEDCVESFLDVENKFDVVIANNVLNHSSNPLGFLRDVSKMLSEHGIAVIEVPYWLRQVENLRFDMIYHEHVSYFTAKSLISLLNETDLNIIEIQEIPSHGGSLRLTLSRKSSPTSKMKSLAEIENELGLYEPEFYGKWRSSVEGKRSIFLRNFYEITNSNRKVEIFGIGAAAKANTFLTYYGLNSTNVQGITDQSESKRGKFTPLTRIRIFGDDVLKDRENVLALVLAWNLSSALKEKLFRINERITYLNEDF